jgi:hypothetical protein
MGQPAIVIPHHAGGHCHIAVSMHAGSGHEWRDLIA